MRHRHRWPYILALSVWLFLPSTSSTPSPTPLGRTRHQQQRQLHRLVGGHMRIVESDSDDSELITASAGENTKNQNGGKKEDERKTLSQQVADGKYGLIQKELFRKPPKRPGIISYSANSEVPNDNRATLGGLTKNEIWLAENHLLVIKGGTYPSHDDSKQDFVGQAWQPIDDLDAPLHQVKIPKNPAVPPPFPVQLTEDGPLQILGTNSSRTLNASAETPAYALPPPPGWDGEIPPQGQYFPETGLTNSDPANPAAGQVTMRVPVSGEPPGGMPFPPTFLNGSLPPFFEHLPPGAVILPPPRGNETNPDMLDEDDPSIYYPPPYSFFYPKDNSSLVPPGPLVPGIILPPPPKFFGHLEEPTTTTRKPTRPTYTTKHTQAETATDSPLSNEISTVKPAKTVPTKVSVTQNVSVRVSTSRRPYKRPGYTMKTTSPTTGKPKFHTILPVHVNKLNRTYLPAQVHKPNRTYLPVPKPERRKPPVTVLIPVKNQQEEPKEYPRQKNIIERPQPARDNYNNYVPRYREKPKHKEQKIISSTQLPLQFHASIEVTSPAPQPELKFHHQYHKSTTTKPQANIYYYEDTDPALNAITTESPRPKQNHNYYNDWTPYFPIEVQPTLLPPHSNRKQPIYVTAKPAYPEENQLPFRHSPPAQFKPKSQNTFNIHIAKLQNQLQQRYTTPKTYETPTSHTVYQYSFEAQNYRRPGGKAFRPSPLMDGDEDSFKPIQKYSVQIQPAIEIIPTQQPNYQQVQQLSVEEPSYYSSERPSNGPSNQPTYVSNPLRYIPERQQNNQDDVVQVTPSRPIAEFSYSVTPNPVHQGYYTKPDEGYFDENTKQYFTIFGRKLQSSTTPLPPVSRPPLRGRYNQAQSVSLHSDVNVNYLRPRPTVNPQSEALDNENRPEIIKAIEITPSPINSFRGNRERYIHYSLPGDEGAQFYFLTPQAERRRQTGEYFYERGRRAGSPGQTDKNPNKDVKV